MTLLEILAERMDALSGQAMTGASMQRSQNRPLRAEYYRGKMVAYGECADMLRLEASKRGKVQKEEPE